MIFAIYTATPGRKHPQRGKIGETWIACWLRVRSFAEARRRARRALRSRHWNVEKLEEMRKIFRKDYRKRDSGLRRYKEALVHSEVYECILCPLFPVYYVQFQAVAVRENGRFPAGTRADVEYWVCNRTVNNEADAHDDFWGKSRHVRKAFSPGAKRIRAGGWRVTETGAGRPVNDRSFGRSLRRRKCYSEAEEFGDCLAFFTY